MAVSAASFLMSLHVNLKHGINRLIFFCIKQNMFILGTEIDDCSPKYR
jgi:hypothetical protein